MKEIKRLLTILIYYWTEILIHGYNLTILHTNDVHARFEKFNKRVTECTEKNILKNECFGGAARRVTAINDLRSKYTNTILVDGGDQFQGTIWYSVFKWEPIARVMEHMGYDAMAFGNHEFDDGLAGLVPFAKNLTSFPIVNSNIDSTGTDLEGTYLEALRKTIGDKTIGVVGFTTPETFNVSSPGTAIKFRDEVTSLQEAVNELINDANINIIIAIGHSGISKDREICKKVKGIDVVVGGHSNTFLYTGDAPSNDEPVGNYPEVYRDSGAPCLVVQDYAFGKYLGVLEVQFNGNGVAEAWSGNPILLDNKYEEDEATFKMLEPYKISLKHFKSTVVGRAGTSIIGTTKACRLSECNLGNFLTDAAVFKYIIKDPDSESWAKASISVWNGGGMRDFSADMWENITLNDLHTIMPFGNMLERILISGKNLRLTLEQSVKDYSEADMRGRFLQVSGLKVVYDLTKPNGERVVSVMARCLNCTQPKYEPLKDDLLYGVVTTGFLLGGGDGHIHLTKYIYRDNSELLNIDVVREYLQLFNPIMPQIEGRIMFANKGIGKEVCQSEKNAAQSSGFGFMLISTAMVFLMAYVILE